MEKFDPHNHERYYLRWRENGSPIIGVTEANKRIILEFLDDMEIGANVNPSSKKGARSFGRLRNIKAKLQTMLSLMETELGITGMSDLENKDMEILKFFKKFRDGQLACRWTKTKPLRAIGTYARCFKSFWHWYQRKERRNGRDVRDITADLDSRDGYKPHFNYFTIDDLKKLCNACTYDYKVMMMFMFDTGIRSPTELMNVIVSDLEWNPKQKFYTLSIREETSKTFGRKIKLLVCSEILKEYIENNKLDKDFQIFKKDPHQVNTYLKRLGYRILKLGATPEMQKEEKYKGMKNGLTMYDFRHSSACYWLPKYKSESAMKYRFGWKKSDMIYYYTELLGMKDTISEDDLYTDITKTELEQQIELKGKEMELMAEKMEMQQTQMATQQSQMENQDKKMKEMMEILRALQLERMVEEKLVIQTPR